jgi:hypothetical protein
MDMLRPIRDDPYHEPREKPMTHPNGGGQGSSGNGDGGGPSTSAQKQQYELLGFIQILSFTATPPQVAPFEPTTLSWTVRLPTTLHVPVSLGVAGQMSHGTSGSATVAPFATTQYGLTAQTAIVSRAIGSLTVPVAASACQSSQIPGLVIVDRLRDAITQQFQGSSQFSLTGSGVSVTISDHATIPVSFSLSLNIPDWFDATMTVKFEIEVGMQGVPPQGAVLVRAIGTNVDVSFEWYSTALSLGVSALVADAMQQLAQAFMAEIASSQIATGIGDEVNNQVQTAINQAQQSDSQGRAFTLTVLTLAPDGIAFTICPLPAASPHPVHPVSGPPGQGPVEPAS